MKTLPLVRSPFPFELVNKYEIWFPDDIEMADKAEIGYYEGCGCTWDAPQMAEGQVATDISIGFSYARHG